MKTIQIVTVKSVQITNAEYELIIQFRDHPVKMIKFIKGQYNLPLKEAKDLVDVVINNIPEPGSLGELLRAKLNQE